MKAPTISVIGLGASGLSAARLALHKGETVHVSDASNDARTAARGRELEQLGADVELGSHDLERISAARLVVVSPGIAPSAPVLRDLRSRGIRWISEPEFAVRFYKGSLIAITGTNGKTTTATLTAYLLERAGIRVALGGNVGGGIAPPASDLALLEPSPDWYVLEVSSFQLADTVTFAPHIGVVTNLAADHLDRYPDTATYHADKARLFLNARPSDHWVLNGEEPATLSLPGGAAGHRHPFAWEPPAAAFVRNGVLTLHLPECDEEGENSLIPVAELPLIGRHNVMNALAASLAARLAGAAPEGIRAGLRSFRPLPHRLEPVGEWRGVTWVNDSKATNVAAAAGALRSLDPPVVLLLGGSDKGEEFGPLAEAMRGKVRCVILFGASADRIERELRATWGEAVAPGREGIAKGRLPELTRVDGGLAGAVKAARSLARIGDIALLSPACASFDEFTGYAERGSRFRELVTGAGEGGEER